MQVKDQEYLLQIEMWGFRVKVNVQSKPSMLTVFETQQINLKMFEYIFNATFNEDSFM